jgi:choline dehydrogenase-like flavoprotein
MGDSGPGEIRPAPARPDPPASAPRRPTIVREPVAPTDWSARDLATLAEVFETFVPGGSIRRAAMAAGLLSSVADPSDLRRLRLVLRALESRTANAAMRRGMVRFRDLSPERREALLLDWSTSRVSQRRTAYQALKRLACFLAYADPGADGANPAWARIGYRVVDEPVTADPPAVRPLDPTRPAAGGRVTLDADVVVVGSGAGGGVLAAALAEAGRDVLVVEAGPFVPETAMTGGELDGFDRMYLDRGLTSTSDLGVAILAGATLGGGTVVNWATCFAPPGWLREEWAKGHGLEGFDGPDTAADVAALQEELGFEPPPGIPPKDRAIVDGATVLGWQAAPLLRDASGCGDCGACGFGCRRAAKRSGPRAHLAAAAGSGARFLVDAPVERILMEGGRATGVVGRIVGADGASVPYLVRARQVVVAAGALRTPVILERSGFAHPALGANLRLHPVAVVAGRMPWPVEMWRGTMQAAGCTQFLRPGPAEKGGPGPAHGGFLIESAPGHPGLIAMAFPWTSAAGHRLRMERARSYAPLIGIVRDGGSGRVITGRRGAPRIVYALGPGDAHTARRALVEMARLVRAAGAAEVLALGTPAAAFGGGDAGAAARGAASWDAFLADLSRFDFAPNRGFLFSAHQMGTARAGSNPRTAACDPWGRLRADTRGALVPGLYVADSSLFPTASGVNPMVTVMALARRVARTVRAEG